MWTNSLFERWNRILPTTGRLGHALFLVALFSGTVLVLPFDVDSPFLSLQEMALADPGGSFFRALHFWSGQLFLAFVVLHVIEHLVARTEHRVGLGLWFRLVVSIPAVLLLLLGGFILRGDAEGLMARQILAGLLETTPLLGDSTSLLLLGGRESLQVIYAHHLGLLTVLVLLVLLEHSRPFWPSMPSWVLSLSAACLLALAVPPGLHQPWDPELKGPWYFLGFQELLHWTSRPGLVVLGVLLLLLALAALPLMREKPARALRWGLVLVSVVYTLLTLVAWLFRGPGWVFVSP